MKSIITSAIALILFIAQSNPGERIIGMWQAVEDADGLRSILEFRRDGIFCSTFGLVFNFSYRIEGDRILSNSPEFDQSQNWAAIELRIEGPNLVLKTSEGDKITLPRISQPRSSGKAIVGKWGFKGSFFHGGAKGSWIVELTEDGQLRGIVQREPESGRYKARANWLTVRSGGKSRTVKYRIEDGILVLEAYSEKGKEEKYKRMDG